MSRRSSCGWALELGWVAAAWSLGSRKASLPSMICALCQSPRSCEGPSAGGVLDDAPAEDDLDEDVHAEEDLVDDPAKMFWGESSFKKLSMMLS